MTTNLTEQRNHYYHFTHGQGPTLPVNATAVLTFYDSSATRFHLSSYSTDHAGRKIPTNADRRYGKTVLEPQARQELADLALAAGWRTVAHLNTHQVLVTEWLAPWYEGPDIPDGCYPVSIWPRSVISPMLLTRVRHDIPPQRDEEVYDRAGLKGYIVTGNLRPCVSPEGCTGSRVMVQWPEGRSWECTKAMRRRTSEAWQIR